MLGHCKARLLRECSVERLTTAQATRPMSEVYETAALRCQRSLAVSRSASGCEKLSQDANNTARSSRCWPRSLIGSHPWGPNRAFNRGITRILCQERTANPADSRSDVGTPESDGPGTKKDPVDRVLFHSLSQHSVRPKGLEPLTF